MHSGLCCMYWGKWQWVLQSHRKLCLGSGSNILKQKTKVCTYICTYVHMCAAIADGRDVSIITKRDTFWTLIVWLAVRNKMCISHLVSFFVNMFGHKACQKIWDSFITRRQTCQYFQGANVSKKVSSSSQKDSPTLNRPHCHSFQEC